MSGDGLAAAGADEQVASDSSAGGGAGVSGDLVEENGGGGSAEVVAAFADGGQFAHGVSAEVKVADSDEGEVAADAQVTFEESVHDLVGDGVVDGEDRGGRGREGEGPVDGVVDRLFLAGFAEDHQFGRVGRSFGEILSGGGVAFFLGDAGAVGSDEGDAAMAELGQVIEELADGVGSVEHHEVVVEAGQGIADKDDGEAAVAEFLIERQVVTVRDGDESGDLLGEQSFDFAAFASGVPEPAGEECGLDEAVLGGFLEHGVDAFDGFVGAADPQVG